MKPPVGKATQVVITFKNGDVRRLSGDDAHRWISGISDILVWLRPVQADADADNFSWEKIVAEHESVLPMDLDDGSRLYASAVSGGTDYADGMPRQIRLVARDAKGNEVERQYVQTPKLGAVCRIVFLHGKENRDSVVYREAAEELAQIGLIPT